MIRSPGIFHVPIILLSLQCAIETSTASLRKLENTIRGSRLSKLVMPINTFRSNLVVNNVIQQHTFRERNLLSYRTLRSKITQWLYKCFILVGNPQSLKFNVIKLELKHGSVTRETPTKWSILTSIIVIFRRGYAASWRLIRVWVRAHDFRLKNPDINC